MWARVLLLLSVPTIAHAQSTPTAPAPDDPIYDLAVDPADHPGEDYVLLLEEGRLVVEADGRTTFTSRQVAQILTAEGAGEWGELAFRYEPERQELDIDWLRVLEDGGVVRDGPEHQQESSLRVDQAAPVYDDTKVVQATVGGVRAGTIVDYRTTMETHDPRLPGDVRRRWYLNGLDHLVRARFVLDAPEEMDLRIDEHGPLSSPEVVSADGRVVRTWSRRDVEPIELEPFAGFPNDVVAYVDVWGPLEWSDIGRWYASYLDDRPELGADLVEAHEAELEGALTLHDSLSATYRWVAQDIRYVSLALGDGGYRPRTPQEVFETGFGDCKDKTMLFVALARRMGVDAMPVLVSSNGGVVRDRPSLGQFDHMIASVELDEETVYLDVTATVVPFGEIPPAMHGDMGLRVDGSGTAEVVGLPLSDPTENTHVEKVVGRVDLENRFVGSITLSATGTEQYGLRSRFFGFDSRDEAERREVLDEIARGVYTTAVVDSSRTFDGRDLDAPVEVTVWFTAPNLLGTVGGGYLMYLPIGDFRYADATRTRLEEDDERRFPIDVGQVNTPSVYRSEADVELPEGWTVALPGGVVVDGDFGYYEAHYEQDDGNRFVMHREMEGGRGIEAPDRAPDLIEWIQDVATDDTDYVIVDPGTNLLGTVTDAAASELAKLLPTTEDLGAGVLMAADGPSSVSDFTGLSLATPLQQYGRDFAAEEMVFTVGESPVLMASVSVAEYQTGDDASKGKDALALIDPGALFGAMAEQDLGSQMSIGDSRTVELADLGSDFRGWVLELVTPLVTFDFAVGVLVRGRVAISVLLMGPQGLRDEDVGVVFGTVDERVRADRALMSDLEITDDPETRVDTQELLEATDGIALHRLLPDLEDIAGAVRATERLDTGAVPTFSRSLTGRGLTLPLEGSDVIAVDLSVRIAPSELWALKAVLRELPEDLGEILDFELADDFGAALSEAALDDDESGLERLDGPAVGSLSASALGRLRSMMTVDMGTTLFAAGPLVATVELVAPPDGLEPEALHALAEDIYDRMGEVTPEWAAYEAPAAVLAQVEELVELEERARELVDERDFEALFPLVADVNLDYSDLTFEPSTFNSICWWAAVHAHGERALPYCEAALVPDEEFFAARDSRGVARALVGDLEGAAADFDWVVDHAADGEFKTLRAGWMRALRSGENPFTEEVLAELRD